MDSLLGNVARISPTNGIRNKNLLIPASFNLLNPKALYGKSIKVRYTQFIYSKSDQDSIKPIGRLIKVKSKKKIQNDFKFDFPLKSFHLIIASMKYFIIFQLKKYISMQASASLTLQTNIPVAAQIVTPNGYKFMQLIYVWRLFIQYTKYQCHFV